ncbi:MAG: hypothetical protein H6740_22425 [Alphaproteobacteria bacterium]|nr:hypothetical protein [Alphaproteobacteria bacterium]
MSALVATMRLDAQLQARNSLYAIGLGVAVLVGLAVRFLVPAEHIGRGLTAFYILALGGTTFMFGASMILLERGERTLEALRVSMITTQDYVLSKVITLTAFSLVESAIVYAISARGVPTSYGLLLLGTLTLGVFYTLFGVGLAAAYDSVTRMLLPTGTLIGMLLQLPFLTLVGVGPEWLWCLIPSQGPLLLILSAFEPLEAWQWAYVAVVNPLILLAAWVFCRRRFTRYVGLPE